MLNRVVYMPLESVSVDAALARPVHDPAGHVLAGEGQVLSSRLRQRLQQRGITMVPVCELLSDEAAARRRAALEESYDHLFRHWRTTPCMRQLRRLLTEHRVGNTQ